jgi:3-oxoacyl-[acyl-carrier-protein] synthase II
LVKPVHFPSTPVPSHQPCTTAFITGMGLLTPLGNSAPHNWQALLAGAHITDHARIDSPATSRATQFALRAAREALADAGSPSLDDTALIVGTSKGPVEDWLASSVATSSSCDFGLGAIANHLARTLYIPGPRLTVSTACSSGLHALIRGAMVIQSGEASRVLVVATEASVHPLFIGSFERLGILPPTGFGCRPFDLDRRGFVMSEAAAAVVLDARPAPGSVAIDRFAMAADASHLTRNSDDALPLKACLRRVIASDPVDLVHAHGTATPHNDSTELAVLEDCFTGAPVAPHLYSHKGAIGHSLGAAGLVSVVLNVLAHRHGTIPPNVQTRNPMPTARVKLEPVTVTRPVRRSIAVAAGFGGQIAAVSLST